MVGLELLEEDFGLSVDQLETVEGARMGEPSSMRRARVPAFVVDACGRSGLSSPRESSLYMASVLS
ncbi:hypothetical protein [Halostagnicola bangensis]